MAAELRETGQISWVLSALLKMVSDPQVRSPVMSLINQMGGKGGGGGANMNGLLENFNQAGMGDQVKSWVGTGDNKSITPDQVTQALGADHIAGREGRRLHARAGLGRPGQGAAADRRHRDAVRPGAAAGDSQRHVHEVVQRQVAPSVVDPGVIHSTRRRDCN